MLSKYTIGSIINAARSSLKLLLTINAYKVTVMLLSVICFIATSCTKTLTRKELNEYTNNPKNGVTIEKVINGIKYKLTYRSPETFVNQHIRAKNNILEEEVEKLRQQYGQYHHMLLSISQGNHEALKGATNFQQFSSLMQTMGFTIDNHVILTTLEKDTLSMVDFHFARYYGHGKSNDILMVFKKEENKTEKYYLYINEFGLKTGNTRFSFLNKNIKKIRKIRIKENRNKLQSR